MNYATERTGEKEGENATRTRDGPLEIRRNEAEGGAPQCQDQSARGQREEKPPPRHPMGWR